MARVRLSIENTRRVIADPSVQPPIEVWQSRVVVTVRFGARELERKAILDTGAPLSILSSDEWRLFDFLGDITWVRNPPSVHRAQLPVVSFLGGRYRYRLGRIAARPSADGRTELPPTPVLTLCLEDVPEEASDPPRLNQAVVMGLTHGILNDRYLVVKSAETGRREAWLQDERPVEPLLLSKAVF